MILERFKVPASDEVKVPEDALRRTVTAIFEKMGVPPQDAAMGADVLVMTDLRGVETHGVSNMLRVYVQGYRDGTINPTPRLVQSGSSTPVSPSTRNCKSAGPTAFHSTRK